MNAPTLPADKDSKKLTDTQSKEPTEAQKATGNYKKEHIRLDGYDISIENKKGTKRSGKDADGKEWETEMQNDYGYIRGTKGVDGDHIDVFLSDTPEKGDVFVIDQVNPDGTFDEHKVMYGFPDEQSARDAYLSNYEAGWTGLGAITHVTKDEFKKWVKSSKRKTKPFAEYAYVKAAEEKKLPEGPWKDRDELESAAKDYYGDLKDYAEEYEGKADGDAVDGPWSVADYRRYVEEATKAVEWLRENDPERLATIEKADAERRAEQAAAWAREEYAPQFEALDALKEAHAVWVNAMREFDQDEESKKFDLFRTVRKEADKAFDSLSDEELTTALEASPELKSAFGRDGLMEYSRTADRLAGIERALQFQERWNATEELPVLPEGAKLPRKAKMTDFTASSSDNSSPLVLTGVYYDGENGMAISSDTHVLVASKDAYDGSKAGKVVYGKGKNQREEERPLGTGGYPNYLRVIPQGEAKATAPMTMRGIESLQGRLKMALNSLESKRDREQAIIAVRMPDGSVIAFRAQEFERFLGAARMLEEGTLEYWADNRPFSVRGANGAAAVMPLQLSEIVPNWKIDLGDESGTIRTVEEPGAGYRRSTTRKSLFDWRVQPGQQSLLDLMEAPEEEGLTPKARTEIKNGQTGTSAPDSAKLNIFEQAEKISAEQKERRFEEAAQRADEGIDRFQEEYAQFRNQLMDIDGERERLRERMEDMSDPADIEDAEAALEEFDRIEAELDEQFAPRLERLEGELYRYYRLNNTEKDARAIAKKKAQRAMAEVEIRTRLSRKGSEAEEDVVLATAPETESKAEVKTAGGTIGYEAQGHLPDGERGEFALVERKFTLTGEFSLTGSERIESRGDVAFLFRALEDEAIENSFVVYVKDGKPHIQQLSLGGVSATIVDNKVVRAGLDAFGADKVYFIHNHPSGELRESPQDQSVMSVIERVLGDKIPLEGIIVDTTSGRYRSFFGPEGIRKGGMRETYERPKQSSGAEREVPVYRLRKQDFSPQGKAPEREYYVRNADDAAEAIRDVRFGDEAKVSYLVISHNGRVVGNFHTGHESLDAEGLAEEVASTAVKYGGSSVIMYGNGVDIRPGAMESFKGKLSDKGGISLLDLIHVDKDRGRNYTQEELRLGETDAEYGELMKKELEEKETKYAEMDKEVKEASDLALPDVEEEDNTQTNGDGNKYRIDEEAKEEANSLFNRQLQQYRDGELRASDVLYLGKPMGMAGAYMPAEEIVLRQGVIKKARKKHGLEIEDLRNLPGALAEPIFLFQRDAETISVLTEMMDSQGRNLFVSVDLGIRKPITRELTEINDITTIHGREVENVILPILENGSLKDVDIDKGLEWIRNAKENYKSKRIKGEHLEEPNPQSITLKSFDDAAKLIKGFDIHKQSGAENEDGLRSKVRELSEKLNVPVRIVTADELDGDNVTHESGRSSASGTHEGRKGQYSERERRAKGFWNEKDGVVIMLDNHRDVADIENTVVHETVGHYGLRALVGKERMDEFVGEVYDHASDPIKRVVDRDTQRMVDAEADRLRIAKGDERAKRAEAEGKDADAGRRAHYYGDMAESRVEAEAKREQLRKVAMEEYMANMAGRIGREGFEKMSREEQTLWGKIKARVQSFFDKFLRGLGIPRSIKLTDKDIAYILYKSYKNLTENPDIFAKAEDAVMRRVTNFDAETETRFRDPDMDLEETITRLKAEATRANTDNLETKRDAMRAIGGNLSKLRQAMARQKEYDETVRKQDCERRVLSTGLLYALMDRQHKRRSK